MIYNFYYISTQLFNFKGKHGNLLHYWLLRQIKIVKYPRYFKTTYCSISYWAWSINNYYILASLYFECLSFIPFLIIIMIVYIVCLSDACMVGVCLRDREREKNDRDRGRCRKVLVSALINQLFLSIFTCFLGVKLRVLGLQYGADSLKPCFKLQVEYLANHWLMSVDSSTKSLCKFWSLNTCVHNLKELQGF